MFTATKKMHYLGVFTPNRQFESITDRGQSKDKQFNLCAEYLKHSTSMLYYPNSHFSESRQQSLYKSAALARNTLTPRIHTLLYFNDVLDRLCVCAWLAIILPLTPSASPEMNKNPEGTHTQTQIYENAYINIIYSTQHSTTPVYTINIERGVGEMSGKEK